jgi:hypothetical protein
MTHCKVLALRVVLVLVGAACILTSLPWLYFGCMGLFTVIADVGVDEHRRLVAGLLLLGGLPSAFGTALVVVGVRYIRPRPTPRGVCANCNYDLTGIDGVCPECGQGPTRPSPLP